MVHLILSLCRQFEEAFGKAVDGGKGGGEQILRVFEERLGQNIQQLQFKKVSLLTSLMVLDTGAHSVAHWHRLAVVNTQSGAFMTACIYCAARRSKPTVRHDAASLQLQALLHCNEMLPNTAQHSVPGIVYVASVTHSTPH